MGTSSSGMCGDATTERTETPTRNKNNGNKKAPAASSPSTVASPTASYGPIAEGDERYSVKLRVYNLQPAQKKGRKHMTTSLGFGFFHTAVEVFGREWQFGGNLTANPEDCGIFYTPPGMIMPVNQVYEVLSLGFLPIEASNMVIEKAVREKLIPGWTALSYHVLSHNCNHFSEAFVEMLNSVFGTKMVVPAYINRAARFGDVFVPESILKQLMGQTPQAPGTAASPRTPVDKNRKLGHNPTITKENGRHYTIDGIPLKDFQGWGGHASMGGGGAGACNCGNPYCKNNPNGFYQQHTKQEAPTSPPEPVVPQIPTDEEMKSMPVRQLKTVMWLNGISWEGCVEKEDLMAAVRKYKAETNIVN